MSVKLIFSSIVFLLLSVKSVKSSTSVTTAASTTSTTPSDPDSCKQICSKTYTLHTYPQSEHLNACYSGCRFYDISHVISLKIGTNSKLNFTRTKCLNACSEAYKETEYYACSIGCNYNVKVLFNKEETPKGEDVVNDLNDGINPFRIIHSLFQSMLNRGSLMVEQSSMSVYLSRNSDGESRLVVVQSEPEVVVHQYPELMQSNEYDSESVTGVEDRTTTDNTRPKLDVSIWTHENPLLVHHSRQNQNSWSNCFGYQSGVPRWVLASVLFLAIFVLAWICCATTATAPEQHIRRRVGMGSDLKYLCLYEEPVKLVINDEKPPSYQELQAEPLPLKVDIEKNESIP